MLLDLFLDQLLFVTKAKITLLTEYLENSNDGDVSVHIFGINISSRLPIRSRAKNDH